MRSTHKVVILVCSFSCISLLLYIWGDVARVSVVGLIPGITISEEPDVDWKGRAEAVKEAYLHAYRGWQDHAAPSDELLPLSNGSINNFGGWGVTLIDSMDTMYLMGLRAEFQQAVSFVKTVDFSSASGHRVSFFETTIRYVGGLLAAYALSREPVLLEKAKELADRLDHVFDTPSGLAMHEIDTSTGKTSGLQGGGLAEIGTLQLEYTYLAKLTGEKRYMDRASNAMRLMYRADLRHSGGMLPTNWDLASGVPHSPPNTHVSLGGMADSAHEYLLKQYLLTSRTDRASLEMYLKMTTHALTHLLYVSHSRHLLYVTDVQGSYYKDSPSPSHKLEHLSCFFPGLLALGTKLLPLNDLESLGVSLTKLGNEDLFGKAGESYAKLASYDLKELHLWAAEGLGETCWLMYEDQLSGLAPDEVVFPQDEWVSGIRRETPSTLWIDDVERWRGSGARGTPPGTGTKLPVALTAEEEEHSIGKGRDWRFGRPGNLLRPETIESMYILWRVTGDNKWRERGWRMFEAFQKNSRTASGFAALVHVASKTPSKSDSMPSYFMAETLKYFYLMFHTEDTLAPLDKWVFNTEAHPFPVFEWTPDEKKKFEI